MWGLSPNKDVTLHYLPTTLCDNFVAATVYSASRGVSKATSLKCKVSYKRENKKWGSKFMLKTDCRDYSETKLLLKNLTWLSYNILHGTVQTYNCVYTPSIIHQKIQWFTPQQERSWKTLINLNPRDCWKTHKGEETIECLPWDYEPTAHSQYPPYTSY